jgi:hypothetical protein
LRAEIESLRDEIKALKNAPLLIGFVGTDGTAVVEQKTLAELRAAPGGGFFFDLSKLIATDASGGK